jgi:hypothetical protein
MKNHSNHCFSKKNRDSTYVGIELELGWPFALDTAVPNPDYHESESYTYVARSIAQYFSRYSQIHFDTNKRYTHDTSNYWKLVTDSSLMFSGNNDYDEDHITGNEDNNKQYLGMEFVSPPLKIRDALSETHPIGLAELTKVLSRKKVGINTTCGLHVHIDFSHVDEKFLVDLYLFMPIINYFLFMLVEHNRKTSEYIRKPDLMDILKKRLSFREYGDNEILNGLFKDKRVDNTVPGFVFYKYLQKTFPRYSDGSSLGCHLRFHDHYSAINLAPFNRNQYTAEFRHHHSTVDYNEIKHWILVLYDVLSSVESRGISGVSYGFKNFSNFDHHATSKIDMILFFMDFFNINKESSKYYLGKIRRRSV